MPRVEIKTYDGDNVVETRQNSADIDSFVHRLDDRNLLGLCYYDQNHVVHTDDQGNALALTTTHGAVTFLTSDGLPIVRKQRIGARRDHAFSNCVNKPNSTVRPGPNSCTT